MNKELSLILMGITVGTLISLDNIASITLLSSRYGTNIKLIISEIWTHIALVVAGWYVGYLFMPYRSTFSYIAASILFTMGGHTLYEGLFSKRKKEKKHKEHLWKNDRKKEMKFMFSFFPLLSSLLFAFVYLLSTFMPFTSPLTGLIFAIGTMMIVAFTLILSIKLSTK